MNYEIVELQEKVLSATRPSRLSNLDKEISKKIELVWHDFSENCSEVENKVTNKPICTYSNYESDENGEHDVSVGYEVEKNSQIKDGWTKKIIPAGKYAKFIVKGNMVKEVSNFWRNLWQMDLARKFECDFEECQNMDMLNGEVHIYISIK